MVRTAPLARRDTRPPAAGPRRGRSRSPSRFAAAGHQLYLVGGIVRDLLLGRDVRTRGDPTSTSRPTPRRRRPSGSLAGLGRRGVDPGRAVRHDRLPKDQGRDVEITTHRPRPTRPDSRKPDVVFSDAVEPTSSRRDFTVNAMALGAARARADRPVRRRRRPGRRPVCARRWRPRSPSRDDPLRMLRAARFIAGYGLEPDAELVDAVRPLRRPARDRRRPSASATSSTSCSSSTTRARACGSSSTPGWPSSSCPSCRPMRLEQDPIHRHKDVLAHTIAVVAKTPARRRHRCAWPRCCTTSASRRPARSATHGVSVPPPRGGRRPDGPRSACGRCATPNDDVEAVTPARVPAPALPHLPAWAGPTARCAATCATPATCSTSSTS